ncbi:hypothetical protein EG831_05170 [bacterium]|nr:hypothetical protein [bacterium]
MKFGLKELPTARALLMLFAVMIGIVYLFEGFRVLFTLRNNQPWNEIVWAFTGFTTTLPVAWISKYSFRIAGTLYILLALVTLTMILISAHSMDWRSVLWFLFYNCAITATIGIGMVVVQNRSNSNASA